MIQGLKNCFVVLLNKLNQRTVHVRLSAGQDVDIDRRLGNTPTMP